MGRWWALTIRVMVDSFQSTQSWSGLKAPRHYVRASAFEADIEIAQVTASAVVEQESVMREAAGRYSLWGFGLADRAPQSFDFG